MANFFTTLETVSKKTEPFALAIISGIKGSSPQKKGAKAIFYPDGRIDGTLGGGCLEAEVQQRARRALVSGQPEQFELVLDHDFGWDDGLICGGQVRGFILPNAASALPLWARLSAAQETVTWGVREDYTVDVVTGVHDEWLYQETISVPCALWIAGAGHVAQAVTPPALKLDFEVTVFDDRASLANSRYFPAATKFRVDYWENMLADKLPPQPAFGLIVTRGHQHDALALRHWVHQPFLFVGMIGSRRKKRLIFEQFIDERIATKEQLEKVACPVGLDILAHTVDEIALSIMAQLVERRGALVHGRVPKFRGQAGQASSEALAL
jgi:xanthine dehydrogenase accessory factor